ncbi:short-chain dehydrogenase/reductase [Thozetella sp. PMI_491]|nr:short-chain dehydrogenase/reductase [Thozetella sp. PMI_491]
MTSMKELFWAARHLPRDPTDISYKDKSVLVTGANSGLGHAAAIKYARLGANPLILGVRTQEKGEAAKTAIIQASNCSPSIFIIETVDMGSLASVKDFVDRVNARVPRLHVAQLAAGVATPKFIDGSEGYELTFQVNVLSTALMGLLLLPKFRETTAQLPEGDASMTHLSFVNSAACIHVKPEWIAPDETLLQRINNKERWELNSQYYLTKLASMFVVRGLAERTHGERVVINASCPGMCKTNMGRDFPFISQLFMAIFYIFFGRTAEAGSRTLVSATGLGPDSAGQLWTNDHIEEPSAFMKSERGTALYHETWDGILKILRDYIGSDTI